MATWKTLAAFPNYEVSDLGQMRRIGSSKCLTPMSDPDGYCKVRPFQDGVGITKSLHRLIAKTFLLPEEGKSEVNHKNGDKRDNRITNLEWANRSENNTHTRRVLGKMIGQLIPGAKLSDAIVREMRASKATNVELAARFGVDKSIVSRVKSRKVWRHVQ